MGLKVGGGRPEPPSMLHHPWLRRMEEIVHGHVVQAAGQGFGRQGHGRPSGGFPDHPTIGIENSDLALALKGRDPRLVGGRVGEEPPRQGHATYDNVDGEIKTNQGVRFGFGGDQGS